MSRWLLFGAILTGCNVASPPAAVEVQPLSTDKKVTVAEFAADGSSQGSAEVSQFVLRDGQWRDLLSPLAYSVMRHKATELAFTGRYHKHSAKGIYRCAGCRTPLFGSGAKFDSRTGWPSFRSPIAGGNVNIAADGSRDEVLCKRCDSHLGHLFYDGPEPERTRYCINSAALAFEAAR